MTPQLQICMHDGLKLPTDAITQTIIAYGGKGMGKTNLGAVIAEECSYHGLRFSVLDPVGASYGLMLSADGKGPGLDLLVLGGRHGDIPILPTAGAVVADLVADEEQDTLIDISRGPDGRMWGVGDRIRFVTDYCLRLYERQGERMRPLMQIIDECGRFCPQNPPRGAIEISKCIHAIEQLVELGRNVGVGVTMITQRSARMNKSISELAECMFAFRTVGPRSVDAIMDWCSDNVDKAQWTEIRETVRKLPRGSALVVSPGWLDYQGVVQVRKRHTFDSSATPTGAGKQLTAARATKPDLDKYRLRMAETIAQSAMSDPKVLQKRVAQLEKELDRALAGKNGAAAAVREVPVLSEASTRALQQSATNVHDLAGQVSHLASEVHAVANRMNECSSSFGDILRQIATTVGDVVNVPRLRGRRDLQPERPRPAPLPESVQPRPAEALRARSARLKAAESNGIGSGELQTLAIVAQGPRGITKHSLRIVADIAVSTRNAHLKALREAGYTTESGAVVQITPEGRKALPPHVKPLPKGRALLEHYLQVLGPGEREVLNAITRAHPSAILKTEIDKSLGVATSTRNAHLQRLAARGLIQSAGRGAVVASPELF